MRFLAQMAALAKTPLQSFSAERRVMPQRVVPIASTAKAAGAPAGWSAFPELISISRSRES